MRFWTQHQGLWSFCEFNWELRVATIPATFIHNIKDCDKITTTTTINLKPCLASFNLNYTCDLPLDDHLVQAVLPH